MIIDRARLEMFDIKLKHLSLVIVGSILGSLKNVTIHLFKERSELAILNLELFTSEGVFGGMLVNGTHCYLD
jgi:hypothetical protein